MLCYLGMGLRHYGLHPLRACRRPYWEFQAVLRGSISLVRESGPDLLRKKHLWLSSPQFAHGWTGEGKKSAEVVVFQFQGLPEPLNQLATAKGSLDMPLSDAQCARLLELAQGARHFWKQPNPGMILYHQHVLMELSWLVYSSLCLDARPNKENGSKSPVREYAVSPARQQLQGHERVNAALHWYQAHLSTNPGLEQVARAVGLSSSQLRRLFWADMGTSPKKMFDQLRFQHAMELMSDPQCKLSTVGTACGFDSASAFSRAFKQKFGISPDKWRG